MTVSVERFGKDHWSALLFIETRVVDHRGWVKPQHMRTDLARHPAFAGERQAENGHQYPTRLKNGELCDHDDWDCLYDLVEAGLVKIRSPRDRAFWEIAPDGRGPLSGVINNRRYKRGGLVKVVVALTPLGWKVAEQLRAHRGTGGGAKTFVPILNGALVGPPALAAT